MSFLGTYAQPFVAPSVPPDPVYPSAYYPGTADAPYFVAWPFAGCGRPDYGSPPPHAEQAAAGAVVGAGSPPRFGKRRVTANRKERRRTLSINNAFAELRECIPNVPSDTKLSKIKTLRLATSYIAYLMDLLAQGDPDTAPPPPLDFKADVVSVPESRDDRRKQDVASLVAGINSEKKAKGRTGWPQHVWALELKHDSSATT